MVTELEFNRIRQLLESLESHRYELSRKIADEEERMLSSLEKRRTDPHCPIAKRNYETHRNIRDNYQDRYLDITRQIISLKSHLSD